MNRGITDEQYQMIELLLKGKNITDISKIINKSRTTIYCWINTEVISQEIKNRKSEMRAAAKDKINSNVNKCILNIMELANNCADPRVRLQANKYIIDQGLGSPSAAKEEVNDTSTGKEGGDKNTLKAELEDIKNIRAIK